VRLGGRSIELGTRKMGFGGWKVELGA